MRRKRARIAAVGFFVAGILLAGCDAAGNNAEVSGEETTISAASAEETVETMTESFQEEENTAEESSVEQSEAMEEQTEETKVDLVTPDVLLTEPPELKLKDVLSSTLEEFTLVPGIYEWNYMDKHEITGIVACGIAAEESDLENMTPLDIPHYQNFSETEPETVSYSLSGVVLPDEITLRKWKIVTDEQTGEEKIEGDCEETVYDGQDLLPLSPDCLYELQAVWLKETREEFYGNASYLFRT